MVSIMTGSAHAEDIKPFLLECSSSFFAPCLNPSFNESILALRSSDLSLPSGGCLAYQAPLALNPINLKHVRFPPFRGPLCASGANPTSPASARYYLFQRFVPTLYRVFCRELTRA